MINLKPVPERVRCYLDAENTFKVSKDINNFLVETKKYLENKYGKSPHFEIKCKNMEQSDNHLTYLLYKDRCVAGVFERRTEGNNLEYIFFRNLEGLEFNFHNNNS